MKKFYAMILAALLSMTMLTGCGGDDMTNENPAQDGVVTDDQPDGGGMTNGDMPDAGDVGDSMLDDMEEGLDPNGDGVVEDDMNKDNTMDNPMDNQTDTTAKP